MKQQQQYVHYCKNNYRLMYIEFDFQKMTIITHVHRMSDTFAKGSYYKKKVLTTMPTTMRGPSSK